MLRFPLLPRARKRAFDNNFGLKTWYPARDLTGFDSPEQLRGQL